MALVNVVIAHVSSERIKLVDVDTGRVWYNSLGGGILVELNNQKGIRVVRSNDKRIILGVFEHELHERHISDADVVHLISDGDRFAVVRDDSDALMVEKRPFMIELYRAFNDIGDRFIRATGEFLSILNSSDGENPIIEMLPGTTAIRMLRGPVLLFEGQKLMQIIFPEAILQECMSSLNKSDMISEEDKQSVRCLVIQLCATARGYHEDYEMEKEG